MRKALVIFLFSLAGLILLVFLVLNLSISRKFATRRINRVFENAELPLQLGSLEKLLPNSVEATCFTLTGPHGDTLILAAHISAGIRPLPLLRGKIILKDVYIHGARVALVTDEATGNFSIADAFSSGKEKGSGKKKSGSRMQLSIRSASLEDVGFRMEDPSGGIRMQYEADALELRRFSLLSSEQRVDAGSLSMQDARGELTLTGKDSPEESTTGPPWNIGCSRTRLDRVQFTFNQPESGIWLQTEIGEFFMVTRESDWTIPSFDLDRIRLEDTEVRFKSPALPALGKNQTPLPFLTGDSILWLKGINLDVSGAEMDRTHARLDLKEFRAATAGDFSIEEASGILDSRETQTRLEFRAATPHSSIELEGEAGAYLATLLAGPGDSTDMSLEIKESALAPADLALFLPFLESVPATVLSAKDPVRISARLDLSGGMLRIPEVSVRQDRVFSVAVKGQVEHPFSPAQIRAELAAMVRSNLGNMDLAGSADFPGDSFSLRCSFAGITSGPFMEGGGPGPVFGSGTVTGSGITGDTLKARLGFDLDSLYYGERLLRDIRLEGRYLPELLTASVSSADSSLGGTLHASVYPGDSVTRILADGSVLADLRRLDIREDTLTLGSHFTGSLTLYPDGLSAGMDTLELTFTTPGGILSPDPVRAQFRTGPEQTGMSASSGFFNLEATVATPYSDLGELAGKFSGYLAGLKDSIGLSSANRLDSLPEFTARGWSGFNEVYHMLSPDTGFRFSHLEFTAVHLRKEHSLRSMIRAQNLAYRTVSAGSLGALVSDSAGSLNLSLNIENERLGNGEDFRWVLKGNYADLQAAAALRIYNADQETVYGIALEGQREDSCIVTRFACDTVVLNSHPWEVVSPGFMTYFPESKRALPDIGLRSGESVIGLKGTNDKGTPLYSLSIGRVGIDNVLRPELIPGKLNGKLTCTIDCRDPSGDSLILTTDLRILQASYSGVDFDSICLSGSLSRRAEGELEARLIAHLDSAVLEGEGSKTGTNGLSAEAGFHSLPLRSIEPVVSKYISDLHGDISGTLRFADAPEGPAFDGKLDFTGAELKVNALNSRFSIPDQELQLTQGKILFDHFRVLDTLNQALTVNGNVEIPRGRPVTTNLDVSSRRLQLMSRDLNSKAPMTGNIFLDSHFTIKGPLNNPNIDGDFRLSRGSEIYYQLLDEFNLSESAQIVDFSGYIPDMNDSLLVLPGPHKEFMKSSIETTVEIDPATLLNFRVERRIYALELDIRGGGSVDYILLDNNRSTLSGRYEIREGEAILKLTGWPNKTFTIEEGGYVRWDGRIDNPELNITAVNQVTSSYINPVDGKRMDADFNVTLEMSDYLSDLDVKFGVQTPDQYITSVLNTLSPEEQMQQAVSILLFETVNLPGISSTSGYMNQQVNQIVAGQLNQITQSSIKGIDISFGLDSYQQPGETGTQTNLTYQVSKSMLNDRAQFQLKGRLYDVNQQPGTSDISLHDVSFEYQLDSAASQYLKVYNERTYEDVFEGEIMKTGVGYTYRKRYESFSDVWRRKKKKEKP